MSRTNWKKTIDYWGTLSPTEKTWIRNWENTFYGKGTSSDGSNFANNNASQRCILNQELMIDLEDIQVSSQLDPETIVMHQEVLEKYGRRKMKIKNP